MQIDRQTRQTDRQTDKTDSLSVLWRIRWICVHVGAYIKLLTHTPKGSVLEGQDSPWLERLVGLGNGVGYLRRDRTVSPST